MNELSYESAQMCVRVGGTVAVLKKNQLNPLIVTKESGKELPIKSETNGVRYFAYGVKLDLEAEWKSQWKVHTWQSK